jgi:CopA family copper-resistance protein
MPATNGDSVEMEKPEWLSRMESLRQDVVEHIAPMMPAPQVRAGNDLMINNAVRLIHKRENYSRARNNREKAMHEVSRRRFVQGLAAGGAVAALDWRAGWAFAETGQQQTLATLTGKDFELTIDSLPVKFSGRRSVATAVNGSVPGPILRWREGDTVTIAVTNRLPTPTSIHWHGVRVPAEMDGVPGLSFAGIAPGKTFVYRIPVVQNGTYWYHSHSGSQEQIGLIGALVIEPRDEDPIAYDRDYVVLLSDWSDRNPETLYSNLKKQSDYYNFHKRTAGTFINDARSKGLRSTVQNRLMWGRTNMTPVDIADVTSATYIYLMNGNPPDANWAALFNPGERVRLRFINASSMTIFDVRIPGLIMTVVQSDGNCVQPVAVDEIRLGVAETYDVIVQPHEEQSLRPAGERC